MKIGFIGLGNMAKAMIGGMLQKEIVQTGDIFGSARSRETLEAVRAGYGIGTRDSNVAVAGEAEVLILAVKPQFFQTVIEEIREVTPEKTLVISIAAGKTMDWIEQAFSRKIKLVRCMPNTPALVGAGCTGVCVNGSVSAEETAFSLRLMESFGRASLVPESLMDAVGAVSGSSPAYVFMFIEAMADAAVMGGMPRPQAYKFAAKAVQGSAAMVTELGKHPGELKDMVCSPAGTTIEAVRVLEERGFRSALIECMQACMDKAASM